MSHLDSLQAELATILNMASDIVEIVSIERDDHTLEAIASTLADMEALIMIGDELRAALQVFAKSRLTQSRHQIDRVIDRLSTNDGNTAPKEKVFKP